MKKNIPKFKLDSGDRVVLAIVGVPGIIYGYAQVLASKPIIRRWMGQHTTASMPILLGVVALIAAVLPGGTFRRSGIPERNASIASLIAPSRSHGCR